jgi:hypothetical protein
MENGVKCYCQHCGIELLPSHTGPCPKCGKRGKDCKANAIVTLGLDTRASSRARLKGKGFHKFKKEILQGQFPSGDPKLSKGVDKTRIIDKEKNEYHETTIDIATGEVTRDLHEPLIQHKSQVKSKENKEDSNGQQRQKKRQETQAE